VPCWPKGLAPLRMALPIEGVLPQPACAKGFPAPMRTEVPIGASGCAPEPPEEGALPASGRWKGFPPPRTEPVIAAGGAPPLAAAAGQGSASGEGAPRCCAKTLPLPRWEQFIAWPPESPVISGVSLASSVLCNAGARGGREPRPPAIQDATEACRAGVLEPSTQVWAFMVVALGRLFGSFCSTFSTKSWTCSENPESGRSRGASSSTTQRISCQKESSFLWLLSLSV